MGALLEKLGLRPRSGSKNPSPGIIPKGLGWSGGLERGQWIQGPGKCCLVDHFRPFDEA